MRRLYQNNSSKSANFWRCLLAVSLVSAFIAISPFTSAQNKNIPTDTPAAEPLISMHGVLAGIEYVADPRDYPKSINTYIGYQFRRNRSFQLAPSIKLGYLPDFEFGGRYYDYISLEGGISPGRYYKYASFKIHANINFFYPLQQPNVRVHSFGTINTLAGIGTGSKFIEKGFLIDTYLGPLWPIYKTNRIEFLPHYYHMKIGLYAAYFF